MVTNGNTTLLITRITRTTGRRIKPKPAIILITQKKTTIPKRNLTVLPAARLPQNSDIRIQRIKRFINMVVTSLLLFFLLLCYIKCTCLYELKKTLILEK